MSSASRRRLGDIIADTLVVRDAQPLAYRGQLAAERRHNSLRTPRVLRLTRHRISLEEREFLLTLCLRADRMIARGAVRPDGGRGAGRTGRSSASRRIQMSGENLVRDLTAVTASTRS